jgi:ABC-type transport system involved in cytochrome bd biosynthesis fused ATPase/permease subunit
VINRVFLAGETLASVVTLLVAILIIILLRAGCIWAGEERASAAATKIKQALRNHTLTHIHSLGPAYLRGQAGESGTQTGELVNLVTED